MKAAEEMAIIIRGRVQQKQTYVTFGSDILARYLNLIKDDQYCEKTRNDKIPRSKWDKETHL